MSNYHPPTNRDPLRLVWNGQDWMNGMEVWWECVICHVQADGYVTLETAVTDLDKHRNDTRHQVAAMTWR